MKTDTHAILFVDDEVEILNALQRSMRSESYPCLYADSGKKAIALLAAQPIAVVVTDMRMPEMDGSQLLKYVRLHYPDTIRLVLSSWADSDDILSAVNRGHVYRYILKPWDNGELRIIVRQARALHGLQLEKTHLLQQLKVANKLLEKKVESRSKQLIRINSQAEIGKYASQIVHNLKNPLQVLFGALGMSQKILKKNSCEHQERLVQYIDMAKRSANNLQQIVAGILMHARDDEHQNPMAIDINEVIRLELEFFEIDPDFKESIEKQVDLGQELPTVLGNSVQIKQIFNNLIRNAIDAMASCSPKKLIIRTAFQNDSVIIEVGDTGEGISEKNLPYIFEPDFSTKPMDKGTGLGLASVQTMVASYGGAIQVESKRGQGTTFAVSIPVKESVIVAA